MPPVCGRVFGITPSRRGATSRCYRRTKTVTVPGATAGSGGSFNPVISIGGFGGDGNNAGNVAVNNTGSIQTAGTGAHGIVAESIGGGGGDGSVSIGLTTGGATLNAIAMSGAVGALLGGNGGDGGQGGDVTVNQSGNITLRGAGSEAIIAQSINGGGGNVVLDFGSIVGSDDDNALVLRAGAESASNSSAGTVTVNMTGTVNMAGDDGAGHAVQAIGGGGGRAQMRVDLSELAGGTDSSPDFSARFGGSDGVNNAGGDIASVQNGGITSSGRSTDGVSLQSIGGGGGRGNLAMFIGSAEAGKIDVGLGGIAGVDETGGNITHTRIGSILSSGESAYGMLVQTIGGGGGAVFTDATSVAVTFSADNVGNGGDIALTQVGDVDTSGAGVFGIFAQSLGGGGGYVDGGASATAGGNGAGGGIVLNIDGSVLATGTSATAVHAQSDGRNGAGNISVRLSAGNAIVGGDNGVAVSFAGGVDNLIDNSGTIMSVNAAAGLALLGTTGNDRVVNAGVLAGSVDLGTGVNAITNQAEAVFQPGAVLNLGDAGNQLRNDGILAPGGSGQAVVSNLSGSYTQSGDARMLAELDFGTDTLDAVIATGSVQAGGTAEISLLTAEKVRPGDFRKTLLAGAEGIVDTGLSLVTAPSVVINYELLFPATANAVGGAGSNSLTAAANGGSGGVQAALLGYSVDFSPTGLGGNLAEAGDYIGRIQTAGSSPELGDTVNALLFAPDMAAYANGLTQLTPDFYAAQQVTSLWSGQRFSQSLAGCESRNSTYRFTGRNSCLWLRFDNTSINLDASGYVPEMNYDSTGISVGFQSTTRNDWTLGMGGSFEDHESDGFGGQWQGDGKTRLLGVIAQRKFWNAQFGATLTYGAAEYRNDRRINLTQSRLASGHRDIDLFGGTIDVSRTFRRSGFSFKPSATLGMCRLEGERTSETGAAEQNLQLRKTNETHNWLKTVMEVGYARALGENMIIRPYAKVGVLHYLSTAETSVRAGLEGAPDGVVPMQVSSPLGDTNTVYEAGFDLVNKGGVGVQLRY
ncbi:MAG: hypothetical protein BMS9Abin08_0250 [Gammaproteobacteria bacterium]|nr:MAG: hypothetical protein BMS9Abin08_0250 [Gammaproteobacteria bacterium]